ncbi:HIT family protein [Niveispirillum irakense]|uniref:HIT family protein n=1 Tax=Niveispirillum irakense TaxID=34011 RepID=UPI0004254B9D|nr:HIT family protein [Niveispirillum irakense]
MTDVPNATLLKFGYPHSVVAETPFWTIQVRPQQPTLGSLVLVCREPVTAFGQVSPAAFAALQPVVTRLEAVLRRFVDYQKINYLMLMMVDPDVHFHVIPRYQGERDFQGTVFTDAGWPGPPNLGAAVPLDAAAMAEMTALLKRLWDEVA